MKTKLQHGRIIKLSDMSNGNLVWTLHHLTRAGRDHFVGSFFSEDEAEQHAAEEMRSRKCAAWRFVITGIEPHLLAGM
jgi:hypothetical protein